MKWELISPPKESTKETLLTNRGIKKEEIDAYLNITKEVVIPFEALYTDEIGTNFLVGKALIEYYVNKQKKIYIIQDCDGDGVTSAALLVNYLYDIFGDSFINVLEVLFHEGKEHGITMDIPDEDFLLIVPDAGTNNVEKCRELYKRNIPVFILDHHPEEEKAGKNLWATIINPLLVDYPSALSGVGVVYKFCKFLDVCYNKDHADNYLDLVSVGMISDMMSLSNLETKFLILEGAKKVLNPFLKQHRENKDIKTKTKGVFDISTIGYYYAPYLNAMCRSGSNEEKENFFKGFLKFEAYKTIETDTKDEMTVCEYAEKIALRVKRRQDRQKTDLKKQYCERIEEEGLDKNSVILLLNDETDFRNIAGLLCNDLKEKYFKPICCLEDIDGVYMGSARGYIPCGIKSFKKFCEDSRTIDFVAGHDNAFGLGIKKDNVESFIDYCNNNLDCSEKTYYVDYELDSEDEKSLQIIKDTVDLGSVWGTGMEEPIFYMKVKAPFYSTRTPMKSKKLSDGTVEDVYTVAKIHLKCGADVVKFYPTDEERAMLPTFGGVATLDIIGKCQKNVYQGITTYGLTVIEMSIHQEKEEKPVQKKTTNFNFIF